MIVVFKYISTYVRGNKKNTKFRLHIEASNLYTYYLSSLAFFRKDPCFKIFNVQFLYRKINVLYCQQLQCNHNVWVIVLWNVQINSSARYCAEIFKTQKRSLTCNFCFFFLYSTRFFFPLVYVFYHEMVLYVLPLFFLLIHLATLKLSMLNFKKKNTCNLKKINRPIHKKIEWKLFKQWLTSEMHN